MNISNNIFLVFFLCTFSCSPTEKEILRENQISFQSEITNDTLTITFQDDLHALKGLEILKKSNGDTLVTDTTIFSLTYKISVPQSRLTNFIKLLELDTVEGGNAVIQKIVRINYPEDLL